MTNQYKLLQSVRHFIYIMIIFFLWCDAKNEAIMSLLSIPQEREEQYHNGLLFLLASMVGTLFIIERKAGKSIQEREKQYRTLAGHSVDITGASTSLERTVHSITYHDPLTHLPNRTAFVDELNSAIAAAKNNKHALALLFIDMDRFKAINDYLGHKAGDALLRLIADRLKSSAAKNTTIYRIGSDEFTVLLPKVDEEVHIMNVSKQILKAFEEPFKLGEHKFHLFPSIGISSYPNHGEEAEDLIKRGDMALYCAKKKGNMFVIYNEKMENEFYERLMIEEEMRQAIKRHEFELHYQPQMYTQGNEVMGVEALIRWNNAKLGFVPPSKFIPIAEETGLIIPIGKWVLQEACTQAKRWKDKGSRPIQVSVNLSPRQLEEVSFTQMVSEILQETGLDGSLLQLEITEGTLITKVEETIVILKELKRLGIQISIDDFGTGFSSLSYLSKFPLDVLKIDQSFVRHLNDHYNQSIITAIISLAANLNLCVIAEGVETEEQSKFLQEHGCSHMQGYLFSKPVPARELEEILKHSSLS